MKRYRYPSNDNDGANEGGGDVIMMAVMLMMVILMIGILYSSNDGITCGNGNYDDGNDGDNEVDGDTDHCAGDLYSVD